MKARPQVLAAKWDGGSVTAEEVRREAQRLPTGLREQFVTPEGQRQFVDALVAKRLLAQEARRRGLLDTDAFRAQLREFEERTAIQALLSEEERRAPSPSTAELEKYFGEHRAEFRTPPSVRVARLLVSPGAGGVDRARAKLLEAKKRLAKKEPLSKVALLGEGAERLSGGDIGWVTEDNSPENHAALALSRVGEVSDVVPGASGVALFVLLERREAHEPTFDEARELVAGRLGPLSQRRLFDSLVSQLRQQSQVEVNAQATP